MPNYYCAIAYKTPNAYLLTGIRGVGKTTTARLIAKALNCKKFSEGEECKDENCHCKEINGQSHGCSRNGCSI